LDLFARHSCFPGRRHPPPPLLSFLRFFWRFPSLFSTFPLLLRLIPYSELRIPPITLFYRVSTTLLWICVGLSVNVNFSAPPGPFRCFSAVALYGFPYFFSFPPSPYEGVFFLRNLCDGLVICFFFFFVPKKIRDRYFISLSILIFLGECRYRLSSSIIFSTPPPLFRKRHFLIVNS